MSLRKLIPVLVLSSFVCVSAQAQPQTETAGNPMLAAMQVAPPSFNMNARPPETKGIPFFDNLTNAGAKLYFMGERSGLYGWLIVKNGQLQMVYMPQDRQSVLIGAMFTDKGDLVTSHQVNAVSEKNPEVAAIMKGAASQEQNVIRAGVTDGGIATLPADRSASNLPPTAFPALPASPGERLMMDLQASAGVVINDKINAPELVVVISPDCSYCKKTWAEMRDVVKAGKLRVRFVPISRDSVGEETRRAAMLLRVPNVLDAWDKYASGDQTALAGEPDEMAYRAIVSNREMTDRWNILGTPYLLYRSKDGKIKIVQGKPERMAAVLADLIQ